MPLVVMVTGSFMEITDPYLINRKKHKRVGGKGGRLAWPGSTPSGAQTPEPLAEQREVGRQQGTWRGPFLPECPLLQVG